MNPNTCSFFRPSVTAAWICCRWITPDSSPWAITQFAPFCSADLECDGKGVRTAGLSPEAVLVKRVAEMDGVDTED